LLRRRTAPGLDLLGAPTLPQKTQKEIRGASTGRTTTEMIQVRVKIEAVMTIELMEMPETIKAAGTVAKAEMAKMLLTIKAAKMVAETRPVVMSVVGAVAV